MTGSVKASGAPDGSRRQRETTHEVFTCIRSCERVAQKARKNAKIFHFTQGIIAQRLGHRWKIAILQADGISLGESSSKMLPGAKLRSHHG